MFGASTSSHGQAPPAGGDLLLERDRRRVDLLREPLRIRRGPQFADLRDLDRDRERDLRLEDLRLDLDLLAGLTDRPARRLLRLLDLRDRDRPIEPRRGPHKL